MDFKHIVSGIVGMLLALAIGYASQKGYDVSPCQPNPQQSPVAQAQGQQK